MNALQQQFAGTGDVSGFLRAAAAQGATLAQLQTASDQPPATLVRAERPLTGELGPELVTFDSPSRFFLGPIR